MRRRRLFRGAGRRAGLGDHPRLPALAARRGGAGLASANLAFAPSPPQLRRLVEAETLPVRHQAARLEKLLRRGAGAAGPRLEERRAVMAARLKALSRSLA